MGQQEIGLGRALRRMILVLAVAALIAAVMAASAMPAMAKNSGPQKPGPPIFSGGPATNDSASVDHIGGGACVGHSGNAFFKAGPSTGGGC